MPTKHTWNVDFDVQRKLKKDCNVTCLSEDKTNSHFLIFC